MKIVEGSNLLIDLDPEIAAAFTKSTSVVVSAKLNIGTTSISAVAYYTIYS